MTVVNDLTSQWSEGVLLNAAELYQCKVGSVNIATGDTKPVEEIDGVTLVAGQVLPLESGLTVYWRRNSDDAALTRTVTGA